MITLSASPYSFGKPSIRSEMYRASSKRHRRRTDLAQAQRHLAQVELRALGAEVAQSGPINEPFFSASGVRLLVNGHQVSVYGFPTNEGAAAAAGGVSADGSTIVGDGVAYNVLWVGPPHFFLRERVIVLYVGDDGEILELLEGVLGPQFAGR